MNDVEREAGKNEPVGGSAGKERGTGEPGFVIAGLVVVASSCPGSGLYFFLAASVVRAARHARKEEDIQGEQEQQPFHKSKIKNSRKNTAHEL